MQATPPAPAPAPSTSTATRHKHQRQQPVSAACTASSQHQHPRRRPAPSTSTSSGTQHPAPAPAPGASTSNLSPPRTQPYARSIIRCCRLSVLCLLALWGIYTLQVLFWPTAASRAVLNCAHTFLRIMFYARRQALNQPLFQRVSACYAHNSRAGYCLALGE